MACPVTKDNIREALERKVEGMLETMTPQEVNSTFGEDVVSQKELEEIKQRAIGDNTFMEAPNGSPTNLTEEQWIQVRTQSFKNWFGDWEDISEGEYGLLDENGEPKLFYHRTNSDFNEFDITYHGSSTDAGWLGEGFYFYGVEEESYGYGDKQLTAFLNIRNPYYAENEDNLRLSELNSIDVSKEFSEGLKSDGYDGVFFNGDFREEVVSFYPNQIKSATDNQGTFSINSNNIYLQISDNLVDRYFEAYNTQPREVNIPEASEVSKTWADTFAESIGVDLKEVQQISINGQTLGVNGAALPLQQTVLFVTGNTEAKSEEMMHIAVEMVSQKNPQLYNEMFNSVTSLPMYKDVFELYKNDPFYQTNGKPNINKIKKEVIGKQLTQTLINGQESSKVTSWWGKVVKYLKGLFGNYGDGLQLYRDAVDYILTEDLGSIRDTLLSNEMYLREQGFNQTQVDRILKLANSNITNDELKTAIAEIVPTYAFFQKSVSQDINYNKIKAESSLIEISEDGRSGTINGKPIKNTLVTIAENFLKSKVSAVSDTYKKVIRDIQGNPTSKTKAQVKNVLNRFIDEEGYLLPEQARQAPSELLKDANYDSVENEVRGYLESFPQGTRFLKNNNIFSKKRDFTGQVDIIAIEPDGKTHIYLFQETNFDLDTSMPTIETQTLKQQINAVREVLANQYNISNFGNTRVIPINRQEKDGVITIEVGRKTFNNETPSYLYPVPSDLESTGSPKLDGVLSELRSLFSKYFSAQTDSHERNVLNDTLNQLMRSARGLQVSKDLGSLTQQAVRVGMLMDNMIEEYETSDFKTDEKIKNFTERLYLVSQISENLLSMESALSGYFESENTLKKFTKSLTSIKAIKNDYDNMSKLFTSEYIGKKNGIDNLTDNQVLKGWFTRLARGINQSNIATVELLGRIVDRSKSRVELFRAEYIKKLVPIKKEYEAWRRAKGISLKAQTEYLYQMDDSGRRVNKFIDRYSSDFFNEIVKARESGDMSIVEQRVDIEAYNKDFEKYKTLRLQLIEDSVDSNYDYWTEAEKQAKKEERIKNEIDIYDLSKGVNQENNRLKNFPKNDVANYSKEYKRLLEKGNEPVLKLYNLYQELNERARNLGLIKDGHTMRTFAPFIHKQIAEKFTTGGFKNVIDDIYQSASISQEDVEFLNRNDITGEEEKKLAVRFMYDISKKKVDEVSGEQYRDYSNVSTDLFTNLDLWADQITKFEIFQAQEAALLETDQVAKSILALETTRFSEAAQSGSLVANNINRDYYLNLMDIAFYGKKNAGAASDIKLGTTNNKFARGINKLVGKEVIETSEKDRVVSAANLADGAKRYMILKTLGLKIPTALASFVGTSIQGHIEASKFFTRTEYFKNWFSVTGGKFGQKFGGQKDNISIGLIDWIMPLTRDEKNVESAQQLHQSVISKFSFARFLMGPLNNADRAAIYATTLSYMENSMVEDGKIVNIRESVYSKSNWATLPTKQERDSAKQELENRIKELKDERSLEKIAKFNEDGILEVPGVDRTSQDTADVRARIINLASNHTGMTQDISGGDGNFMFRMFKTFKSWMYPLVERRVGNLRKTPGTDTYDWGRFRIFGNFVSQVWQTKGKAFMDILTNNDDGIKLLMDVYNKQRDEYTKKTGKNLDESFNESRFVELYQQGLRATAVEFAYITAIYACLMALAAAAPDDDEDASVKNFYNYALKAMDKGVDELTFFINPKELYKLGNGGIMPPIAVMKDLFQVEKNLRKEVWGEMKHLTNNVLGTDFEYEEQVEAAQPLKYIIKALPLGSSVLLPIIAISNADAAESLGYRESKPQEDIR